MFDDVVGCNEASLMEPVFSSDEESHRFDDFVAQATRRVARVKRRDTRKARLAKAAAAKVTSAAAAAVPAISCQNESSWTSSDSDTSDDPDYLPPVEPQDAIRYRSIAAARRHGQIINEVNSDAETSSDDWPVLDTMPLERIRLLLRTCQRWQCTSNMSCLHYM